MSIYDETHIEEILQGEGTWFTAQLMRLISKSDKNNRAKLALGFPKEVDAINEYQWGKP
jgi:hypothetical protein